MNFNFDLNLVQAQKLILTPQLKQALDILGMTSQELFEYVEEELEKNPVLEVLENGESGDGYTVGRSDASSDKTAIALTLKEHLMFQLNMFNSDKDTQIIGEYLIENTDSNGYLATNLHETAEFFNLPISKVKSALSLIQSFDPPGICARNLKESLIIQLKQLNCNDEAIINIVENHLDDLAGNKVIHVAKSMKLDIQKISEAFDFIKTLEPKPGRLFCSNEKVKYIIPDIIVRKIDNSYMTMVNDDAIPLIGINAYYKRVLNQSINIDARKFIKNKLDSAVWLIKCIEQRRCTLRSVAERIVAHQEAFMERGRQHLKPLTIGKIAGEIGMHESTISRTLNMKYLQCTWGIFEMRYFFSGRLFSTTGESVAKQNVIEELKDIIKKEDKKRPLSDVEIAGIFNGRGLNISRSTVAKYRSELDIPSGAKRKKF